MNGNSVNMKKTAEKRQFIRIDISNLAKIEEYSFGGRSEKIDSLVKNISAGGILFETNKQYNIGSLLKLEVKIPGWYKYKTEFFKEGITSPSEPFVALATVVRVEVLNDRDSYEIGACFINIDEDHLNALMKYIQEVVKI